MSYRNKDLGIVEKRVNIRRNDLCLWILTFGKMILFHNNVSICCGRMWTIPETKGGITRTTAVEAERLNLVSEGCNTKFVSISELSTQSCLVPLHSIS